MQQIADWLEKLGLGQYADSFAENGIDVSVLRHLTDQDLKDIGVLLGHRRKILAAISELGPTGNAQTHQQANEPKPEGLAERRQVTVMFCDLVGSTALAASMDLEDLREVISAYQKCAAETVRHFDGFVARYMGDGVLIYFGYPQAHEDDAERAARAGLELISAVTGLKTRVSLQARIGIATGMVVVGDLIGSGEGQEQDIVGETPNLAARLQGIAGPDTVVIADATRRLLGSLFELKDLGPNELKGIAGPVRAWSVLRPSLVESRFDALHEGGLTTLVGREDECELLLRRWSQAKAGAGQVVLLSGEAGIGKSRLTAALLERLAAEPHRRLRYFCSPQHTDSAFYPIIGQLERAAHFAHDDSSTAKLDKLDALLTLSSTSQQDAALLSELLSLRHDGRYAALDMAPQQRRDTTIEALISQVERLTRSSPVLMVFEDAHWSDPTTLEVLGRTVDRIATLRVLMIVTFRPDFESPWIERANVTALTIDRLGQREVGDLIDGMIGDSPLPANIRQDIIERTDGIPLFIEEMTKAVLEANGEREARQMAAAIASSALAVPATLYASLMARLDRLGSAKHVAQVGAAIGREFSYALIAAVARQPETDLRSALDRLRSAGLLFRQGVPPNATYLFKHALVQDAAYGTLLREPRRALHARIAHVLENQFTDIMESRPELLARHYTKAGSIEEAAKLWGKAGQQSLERSALVEAVEQLKNALEQVAALPSTPALRREKIKLQVALITPLIHVKGYAGSETKAAIEQAGLLIEEAEAGGEPPEDPLLLFSVLNGLWLANYVGGKGGAVQDLAGQFLSLAQKQNGTFPLMLGHRIVGTSLLYTGDLIQARMHLDRAIALYDPVAHRPLATRFGQDVRMSSLLRRSLTLWSLGYPDAALADSEQSLRDAREIGHAATLFFAPMGRWWTHTLCGNYQEAAVFADELIAFADEKGAAFWKTTGTVLKGWACALTGKVSIAIQIMPAAIGTQTSAGLAVHAPLWLSALANAYAQLGRFDDAWRCIAEAIAVMKASGERWCDPQVYQSAGEIAIMSPEPDAVRAEAYFNQALAIAREQQAKSSELRAATSLARQWRDQGKPQLARELLAPVYGWFTEGFDTLDLKEAKAVLDVLSS